MSVLRIDYTPTSRGYIGAVYRVTRKYNHARLTYITAREDVADCIERRGTQGAAIRDARELRDRTEFYNDALQAQQVTP